MATLLIGADICPIEGNLPFFKEGDAQALFHDLLPEFKAADLAIANLECPFIEKPAPIRKTGPTFGESGACINAIKAAGIDLLCLANNHIMDHGPSGLKNTLEVCSRAGVATVGAGENLAAARQISIHRLGDIRVGVLALAEHEFSIATRNSWGANPLDLIDFVRNVNSRRADFDYLVVLLHGGDEFHVPSPRIQETCRFMVEMGAHAVFVQHPHVLGGYESYRGGHIVYGQGALLMDEAIYRHVESFHEGFLVRLNIASDFTSTMEILPFTQSAPVPGARRMAADKEQEFRHSLEEKTRALLDEACVRERWFEFCQKKRHAYLSGLLGHGRIVRKLNTGGWMEKLYGRRLLGVRNVVCCETHREALETIFDQLVTRNS